MDNPVHILLVEDEAAHAELVRRAFESRRDRVRLEVVGTLAEARTYLADQPSPPDLIISDWRLPDGEGMELLPPEGDHPVTPIIIMTSYGNERVAVEALKAGALDYVVKSEAALVDMPHIAERAIREWNILAEQARMQNELRESERRFRTIIEQSSEGFALVDEQGKLTEWNEAQEQIWGLKHDEVIGLPMWDVLLSVTSPDRRTPEHCEHLKTMILDALQTGQSTMFNKLIEAQVYRPDGERRFIQQAIFLIRMDGGFRLASLTRDITEYKRAEKERELLLAHIQEQAQRVRQIVDTVPEGVLLLDARRYIAMANPLGEEDLAILAHASVGEALSHLGGCPVNELLTPHPKGLWHEVAAAGRTWQVIARPIASDSAPPQAGKLESETDGWVLVVRDVTQEREIQHRIQRQEQLAAVGQLAAGIAHDFNNLLTAINGFTELAQLKLPPGDPANEPLDKVLQSGRRAANLVRQLLTFARRQVIEPKVLELNDVVVNIDKMLQRIIGEDVELKTSLAPGLWPVKVDPTQIEQVIVNLAINARDAMPTGGQLTIETANAALDKEYVADQAEAQPGEYVLLAVSDNGIGMTEEVQAHIFEPFFTTKDQGKGTGLGLATVFGIVKQSGGHIWVHSKKGTGTTFKIYLPRADDRALPPLTSPEAARQLSIGDETILLVEDDPQVRDLARHVLQEQGYTLLVARDGLEALQMAALYAGPIHLLATDVVMPGMSGKSLAAQLAQTHAGLKILFMSGYTDDAIAHHGILSPGTTFLQKPFSPADLARKVRRVLDTPSPIEA
jgi:two-component system cell cycle sensor histidine kinase/response regulator CckA